MMRKIFLAFGCTITMALLLALAEPRAQVVLSNDGDLTAEGAFTCELTLPGSVVVTSPEPIAAALERDRMVMSRQPGMLRKHIPLAIDFATGNLQAGGRYLFDTEEHAKAYKTFVTQTFTIDGVQFLDRPYFLDHDCHSWSVVAARDFADIHTSQVVMRVERFAVPADNQRQALKRHWPAIRAEAAARGYSSVWLLYNKQEQLVALAYFVPRLVPKDPTTPDFATLFALQGSAPLGALLDDLGYVTTFDRTSWSWTIWLPFLAGDHGEPSIWPHSPPLPEPFVGDGVCEPSRGETFLNAPSDCGPTTGDGICQAGETVHASPSDCTQ
jgi:hypothetical protein